MTMCGTPTTAVWTVSVVEPFAFTAVTAVSRTCPMSAAWIVYVCAVAPAIGLQLKPKELQRLHSYVNEVGEPLHVPLLTVRTFPTAPTSPLMVGKAKPTIAGAPTTATVSASAVVEPTVFVAVTTACRMWPRSAFWVVYVLDVAPAMSTQFEAFASHRPHWYPNEVGDSLHVRNRTGAPQPLQIQILYSGR